MAIHRGTLHLLRSKFLWRNTANEELKLVNYGMETLTVPLSVTFADYLMPTASDFPSIHAIALEDKPAPYNPLGAKGAGEGGIIPVGGVIANAVANALGVEPNVLPLSPPRVWELIQSKQ